jgi:hypothetical protein
MSYERQYAAPLPDNLDDALEEIDSLRQRLYLSNQRWAKSAEKCDHVQRSFSGTVKRMQAKYDRLAAQWSSFQQEAERITGSAEPEQWLELLQRASS